MRITRNKCFSEQIGSGELFFIAYERDGTEKYLDNAGNAVFVSRDDIVVEIYSSKLNRVVDDLVLDPIPGRNYADFTGEEISAINSRKMALRDAWDVMLESLPTYVDMSETVRLALNSLRYNLESGVVWLEGKDRGDTEGPLDRAHDFLESIKEAWPEANISSLMMLVANAATEYQS